MSDDHHMPSEAARCARCGHPAEVLVCEGPDWWLCRDCADKFGREAVEQR